MWNNKKRKSVYIVLSLSFYSGKGERYVAVSTTNW